MRADQVLRRYAERNRHAPAVFPDAGSIVVRTEPAIEAGIEAARDAALPGEEGVAQPRNGGEQG